ncbi:MAG TPA: 4-hydroxybenzoate 3-monooxygenase [Trebonia sp.]|nr:4-hydroxybenzoate 3-monooxygenase [Trebonia sp.]
MRTQVAIIGAGPAGLMLSQLLHLQGIESVVLERRDRHYVETRLRAGILEHGTVETLREAGVAGRLDAEGMLHEGLVLRFGEQSHRLDLIDLTERGVTVYGQQEVVKDLIAARVAAGGDIRFNIRDLTLGDIESEHPSVTFTRMGERATIECDFVAGADGFHGISRDHIPGLGVAERSYPYAWLGILAQVEPSFPEVIYAHHPRGFALHSMRSPSVTRLYLQVTPETTLNSWPDERIWHELRCRLADRDGFDLKTGPVLDRSITPMRSFVASPMQFGRLFLAGDAAHIVPPTGAKGLNLAVADVRLLSRALGAYYLDRRMDLLDAYTDTALRRVWRTSHFSWWMTSMLHTPASGSSFDEQLAVAQLTWATSSRSMSAALAENYTGLPYEANWSYR